MTSNLKRKEELHVSNGGVKQSAWSKAISCKAVWDEKVWLTHSLTHSQLFKGLHFITPSYCMFFCGTSHRNMMGLWYIIEWCFHDTPGYSSHLLKSIYFYEVLLSLLWWQMFLSLCLMHFFTPPQDEFLDVVYWFRQIIAIILGLIWGVVPLKGFLGIAM